MVITKVFLLYRLCFWIIEIVIFVHVFGGAENITNFAENVTNVNCLNKYSQ